MAEATDSLSEDELGLIQGILEPLNKNPQNSEDLNPMAKTFRQKMGYAEPIQFSESDSEEEYEDEDNDSSLEQPLDDFSENEPAPPSFKDFEDDDIDLDDLLGESPAVAEPTEEPVADDLGLGDDFGDLDDFAPAASTTPYLGDNDPFASLDDQSVDLSSDQPAATSDEDPFATPDEASIGLGDDPFADLGGELPPEIAGASQEPTDDIFGDLEDLSSGATTSSDLDEIDPFSGPDDALLGGDDFSGFDDFGASGIPEADKDNEDVFGDLSGSTLAEPDPFPDFESTGGGDDLGFDDFGTSDTAGLPDSDDAFGDLGVDLATTANFDDQDPTSSLEPTFDMMGDLEPPSLDDLEPPSLDEIGGDGVLEDELSSLMDQEEGSVDEGLTDEDLAIIQREIVKYPPKLRRHVIDSIVHNRISVKNQKELLELIKHQQKPEDVADYLSEVLGETISLYDRSGSYSDDGVPIISANPLYTREGALRRRKLIRNTFLASAAAILFVTSFFSLYKYVIIPGRASSYYEEGLQSIRLYTKEKDNAEKKRLLREAKEFFIKGEEIDPNSLKYLNAYGVDYMKAGLYDESFEMLFGKVDPPFPNWSGRRDVPFISIHEDSKWSDRGVEIGGRIARPDEPVYLTSQDRKKRRVIKAGAYIVARVKDDQHHIPTYINLGKFHSFHSRDFVEGERSKAYKNDTLAIEYYKRVFTDSNSPDNIIARAGIARIYYNKKEFPKAASEYNKIIEIYPKDPVGHGGLLSSYIEIWKRDGNPQFVLNHHRIVKNQLGIEDDLSLFILSKLASFYIDLDPEETRVRYNVTPGDQVTGMDIDDNATAILATIFNKTEVVDGEKIVGSKYAEGYYQRGRLFLKQNEALRAMKQFELAASYDFAHFPAVLRMGEYYMRILDYSEAENLLRNSEKRYKDYRGQYGRRDEDETLMEGDPGRIYFDRGKILYLNASGILEADQIKEFPGRKIYPERAWIKIPDQELERRRRGLYLAQEFFSLAQTEPHILQNSDAKREMIYYEGWIDYMLGSFGSAINKWTDLDEEDLYHNTTLLMGMGNASYYTNQLNSAQSYYHKVMEDYEAKEAMIKRVVYEDQDHQEIYQILVASYNNLGAVHERKGDMVTALSYYWKAIEAARKIDLVSEVANSNKDLLMKKEKLNQLPLLEDWLSPTLGKLRELIM